MSNGQPVNIPVAPAAPVVIHTLPADATSGLAFLDVISLTLQNSDQNPAEVAVIFTPAGGGPVAQVYVIAPGASLRVLDEDAFGGPQSGLGGATISLSLAGGEEQGSARAWGWFFRSRG